MQNRRASGTLFYFATFMLHSNDASAILDGTEAATCDWPSVINLRSRSGDLCTGVYVGGRIIITAAHCDDGNGLYYNYTEIYEYAGVVSASSGACDSDADCPMVTIETVLTQMKCDDEFGEHPGPSGSCYLDDESFSYTNFAVEALFGEAYDPFGAEQPYNLDGRRGRGDR